MTKHELCTFIESHGNRSLGRPLLLAGSNSLKTTLCNHLIDHCACVFCHLWNFKAGRTL